MRPLVIHVADRHIEGGLRAFFRRDNWFHALGCGRFDLDAESPADIYREGGQTDGGIWRYAHQHLKNFRRTHERAIVILDEDFSSGGRDAGQIRADIAGDLAKSGWAPAGFEVIVIRPMLEAWLWMDSPQVAEALGCADYEKLKQQLAAEGLWAEGAAKPLPGQFKAARDRAAALGDTRSGGAAFRRVFGSVSFRALNRCREEGFVQLRQTLQTWFPKGEAA